MPYVWCEERWELLAGRGLYWPRHQALLVADLHLGKELVYRKSGIAIPEGATEETLERLDGVLEATGAMRLWVAGDLFHARSGLSSTLEGWLMAWRQRHRDVEVELVAGNHDRGSRGLCQRLGIGWRAEPWQIDGIALHHHPPMVTEEGSEGGRGWIAGHLHPKVGLPKAYGIGGSWPCFQFTADGLVLPAFGEFTGGQRGSDFSGPSIAIVGTALVRVS